MSEYRAPAARGKWEEARATSVHLNGVCLRLEEILLWQIVKTNTCAGTVSSAKTWFETIGLKGSRMIPPLPDLPSAQADVLHGKLQDPGVC